MEEPGGKCRGGQHMDGHYGGGAVQQRCGYKKTQDEAMELCVACRPSVLLSSAAVAAMAPATGSFCTASLPVSNHSQSQLCIIFLCIAFPKGVVLLYKSPSSTNDS